MPTIKNLLSILRFLLLSDARAKSVPVNEVMNGKNGRMLSVSREDLSYHFSSNVVLEIKHDHKTFFFRECERHLPLAQYVEEFVGFYYSYIAEPDFAESDRKLVQKSLSDPINFGKFRGLLDSYFCADLYPGGKLDLSGPDAVGLLTGGDEALSARLKRFLKFAVCKMNSYCFNDNGRLSRAYQTAASARELSFQALAKLLCLEELIPHSEYCLLYLDEKIRLFGTLMNDAGGIDLSKMPEEELVRQVTPGFQRALVNLNLLQYLAGCCDFSVFNFRAIPNAQGKLVSVCSFDNNEPGAFDIGEKLFFKGTHGEDCIVDKSGTLCRPYLDADVATRILSLKKSELYRALRPYWRSKPILRVWQRVLFLKKAIQKAVAENPHCLLSQEEWSLETMMEETSGKYGMTYLKKVLGNIQI